MRIILALLAVTLAMVGCALADGTPTDWNNWAIFSYSQLDGFIFSAPATSYASSWTHATADASNDNPDIVNPWTFTYTSAIANPTESVNYMDPCAKVGASTQSISAFGDKTSGWGDNGIMFQTVPLNPSFDNVAVAQTSGLVEADGIHQAWAVLPTETNTYADSDSSSSESWAVGSAVSDENWDW